MDSRKTFGSAIIILLLSITCSAQVEDTLKILFVGNSYTYFGNLPQIISIISDSSKTKLVTNKSTAGGAKLSEHWRGEKGLKTKAMIINGRFDIVVLQEYSWGTIKEPDSVLKYSKLLCDLIKENGAKPYLFLTWAREKVPQYQETINKIYLQVAAENDAVLVPVGKAWELARQQRPKIELYDPDGSHPSGLGSFLAACVFVGAILHEIPSVLQRIYYATDAGGESVLLMNIHPLDVIFCQKIAEEVAELKY